MLENVQKPARPAFRKQRTTLTSGDFPLARYISLVSVHSLLLAFTLVVLPRSHLPFQLSSPSTSSSDRPTYDWVHQAITRDPLGFALWSCAGATVVGVWWAEQLGGLVRQKAAWDRAQAGKKADDGGKGSKEVEQTGQRLKTIQTALFSTLCAIPFITVLLLLLGAPLSLSVQTQVGTILLSTYLCLLVVFGPVSLLGAPPLLREDAQGGGERYKWVRLFVHVDLNTPYELAYVYPVLGALAGAWMGVLPLALDWDRPWQAWPITPIFGSTIGYVLGHWASVGLTAWHALVKAAKDGSGVFEK